jgi:hypothetical protein
MSQTISEAYCNVNLPGAFWISPLKNSLELIDQSTLHKVAKVFLSCIACFALGIPAFLGIAANIYALKKGSAVPIVERPVSPPPQEETEKVGTGTGTTLRSYLERLNQVFTHETDQAESANHSVELLPSSEYNYENDQWLCLNIRKPLTEEEIDDLVEKIDAIEEQGIEIGLLDIPVSCHPNTLRNYVQIKLMIPDEFDIGDERQKILDYLPAIAQENSLFYMLMDLYQQ